MNTKNKYRRDKGKPIGVRRAQREHTKWLENPKNNKYPASSFPVPFELLTRHIKDPKCSAVKFCNGLDANGDYYPVICTVTEAGEVLGAFDTQKDIDPKSFDHCRTNWMEQFPMEKGDPQFFYLGVEVIKENIESFEVGRYVATFVENGKNEDTGLLMGYPVGGMKDPGDEDEDPDTALNFSGFCPPLCEGEG